jgi:hypothetical protein
MTELPLNQRLHYTLRVAVALCFIGHGAFGIITKATWCNYFGVFGIGTTGSYQLMPVIGSIDILMGMMMLVYPVRAIAGWLVVWGAITALMRPLSGEPVAEFVERVGNFGAPLALLILSGIPKQLPGWFTRIKPAQPVSKEQLAKLFGCLKIAAFLLLSAHGWLNLTGKKVLLDQYAGLGFADPATVAYAAGMFEVIAACIIVIRPFRSLLFIIFLWKMATEIFYPHYKIFEWVERGGSYGVLLALWLVTEKITIFQSRKPTIAA